MTMKCKYCDQELADWGGFCPVCGKSNDREQSNEQDLQEEIVALDEGAPLETDLPVQESGESSSDLKKAKRVAAMSGCIAVLAVLATVLFFGIRGGWKVGNMFDWLKRRENTIHYREAYTVKDKKAIRKKDKVVATMGDQQLTNAQLQIYYWTEIYGFQNDYYYYLSYLGIDFSKPLAEQTCYFDPSLTWEQYFLDNALHTWQSYAAFTMQAREKGFQLPENYRKDLDSMSETLQKEAAKSGYESVDAMVADTFGAGVTLSDYQAYMETYYLGYTYFESLYLTLNPTMEDIEAYYAANEEALKEQGIKKDGTYTIDVRHILVRIDNVAKEMDKEKADNTTITDEHWAACKEAAEKILNEYLNGEHTEERFGELANKYSHDKGGEVTDGGIYTFVEEGQMVAEFNDWCFDETRKPGDTDLVKTKFGYHVMYFVGSEEVWITRTRSAYIAEQSNKFVEDALNQYTAHIQYKNIVLTNVEMQ